MKKARTIRTLNRCGIKADQIGFAGGHTPSGKAIRRLERRDHRAHILGADVFMASLPRTPESKRGFRAVQREA